MGQVDVRGHAVLGPSRRQIEWFQVLRASFLHHILLGLEHMLGPT